MLQYSWQVFAKTGSVDAYLLLKEAERQQIERKAQDQTSMIRRQKPVS
ncbi:YqzL family protein [Aureibacillus halotolerans]|uniref:YqzL-like protein n=1 Tax=Aureibacillus halotolerans TaxID=1508390 RepID=A0A4R6U662_9BACI|nr:YqzL family protein [Aureibacillus halotolerans]TDQ41731.1 YqzL-like protein [Aureibacillus halotolerans]